MNRLLFQTVAVAAACVIAAACAAFEAEPGATPAEAVYNRNCIVCHGKNGGGADGPNLVEGNRTRTSIEAQIRAGGTGMPAFQGRLADDQIRLAVDWVAALREKAGKPTPP